MFKAIFCARSLLLELVIAFLRFSYPRFAVTMESPFPAKAYVVEILTYRKTSRDCPYCKLLQLILGRL